MFGRKFEELEQLNQLISDAITPEQKKKALDRFLAHVEAYTADSEQLAKSSDTKSPEQKQEAMRRRLAAWDVEVREILAREISDPKILEAALDNSRYKEKVLAIAPESMPRVDVDEKHPLLARVDQALEKAEQQQKVYARFGQVREMAQWALVIGFVVLMVWWAISYAPLP